MRKDMIYQGKIQRWHVELGLGTKIYWNTDKILADFITSEIILPFCTELKYFSCVLF